MRRKGSRSAGILIAGTILTAATFVGTSAIAREQSRPLSADGTTELVLSEPAGRPAVRVVVTQSKLESSFPYKAALEWGGDDDVPPRHVLTSILVQEGALKVWVPLSAFGDLGNAKSASLTHTPKGFLLSIHGGDTASAYDAKLVFFHRNLTERTVALREMPNDRQETTKYKFPPR
jgi:hypothetical protein